MIATFNSEYAWKSLLESVSAVLATNQQPHLEQVRELVSFLPKICSSLDPRLRDELGYTTIRKLVSNHQLSLPVINDLVKILTLSEVMLRNIADPSDSESAVSRSFAALFLAEAIKWDGYHPRQGNAYGLQVEAYSSAWERCGAMLNLENNLDGFHQTYGWIHTIAHLADLIGPLILHPLAEETHAIGLIDGLSFMLERRSVGFSWAEERRIGISLLMAFDSRWSELLLSRFLERVGGDQTKPSHHLKISVIESTAFYYVKMGWTAKDPYIRITDFLKQH